MVVVFGLLPNSCVDLEACHCAQGQVYVALPTPPPLQLSCLKTDRDDHPSPSAAGGNPHLGEKEEARSGIRLSYVIAVQDGETLTSRVTAE